MAGFQIPLQVIIKSRPPEAVSNIPACSIETAVSKLVVGLVKETITVRPENDELVSTVCFFAPESTTMDEKLRHMSDECLV